MKVRKILPFVVILFIGIVFLYLSQPKEGFQSKPMKFVVVGMFKNEEMVIREWVDHYKWQGADHILLLDNNSTDDYKSKLTGTEDFVTVIPAPKKHAQQEQYNTLAVPWLKKYGADIVAIVDVDEYLFAKDGVPLKQHLVKIFGSNDPPSQIYVNWTMFGSSGHVTQPESIRQSFTWRMKEKDNHTKAIFLLNKLKEVNVHSSTVNGRSEMCPDIIQLNHYAIMSKEYFSKVKMTRGDVSDTKYENVRNWDYFNRYDHKDVEDFTLKGLVNKAMVN